MYDIRSWLAYRLLHLAALIHPYDVHGAFLGNNKVIVIKEAKK